MENEKSLPLMSNMTRYDETKKKLRTIKNVVSYGVLHHMCKTVKVALERRQKRVICAALCASWFKNMATRINRTGCRAQVTRARARGRRPTFKSANPNPPILPQCNILSNYPYNVSFFWVSRHRSIILAKKMPGKIFGQILRNSRKCVKTWIIENVNWSQKRLGTLPSSLWKVFPKFFLQMNPIPMRIKQLLSIRSSRF